MSHGRARLGLMEHSEILERLATTARAHHGVFTIEHARAAGMSDAQVFHRVEGGQWVAPFRNVYRWAATPTSWEGDLLGACWAGGFRALASHRSAAALWGLPGRRRDLIEISCPRWRQGAAREPGGARDEGARRKGRAPSSSYPGHLGRADTPRSGRRVLACRREDGARRRRTPRPYDPGSRRRDTAAPGAAGASRSATATRCVAGGGGTPRASRERDGVANGRCHPSASPADACRSSSRSATKWVLRRPRRRRLPGASRRDRVRQQAGAHRRASPPARQLATQPDHPGGIPARYCTLRRPQATAGGELCSTLAALLAAPPSTLASPTRNSRE